MGLLANSSGRIVTGAVVNKDPLPVGRYWITTYGSVTVPLGPGPGMPDLGPLFQNEEDTATYKFALWVTLNAAPVLGPNATLLEPAVTVEKVESYDLKLPNSRPATWWLFNVQRPVAYPLGGSVGFPHEAPPNIQSSTDIVGTEDDVLLGGLGTLGDKLSWVPWAIGGVVVVVGIYSVAKLVRG